MLHVEILRNKTKQNKAKTKTKNQSNQNFQLPTTDLGHRIFQFLTGYWKNLATLKREYFFQE